MRNYVGGPAIFSSEDKSSRWSLPATVTNADMTDVMFCIGFFEAHMWSRQEGRTVEPGGPELHDTSSFHGVLSHFLHWIIPHILIHYSHAVHLLNVVHLL